MKKLSSTNIIPEIGMGITRQVGSDRYPGTIIQVYGNGKKIVFQEDDAIRTDSNGMSECQTYSYRADPNGEIYHASLRKDGQWKLVGSKSIIHLGKRDRYYDFSF